MARTVFLIARELNRRANDGEQIEVVVLVWDMDDQSADRRGGLAIARGEARSWATFEIVLGCPDPMRETWVLAGFDPTHDGERARFEDLRRELGFSPSEQAHRLTAKDEQAKRVLPGTGRWRWRPGSALLARDIHRRTGACAVAAGACLA